jgi:hypothetical protein
MVLLLAKIVKKIISMKPSCSCTCKLPLNASECTILNVGKNKFPGALNFNSACSIGYISITCSTISNIPYNLIFTTKFNDYSILITIISCDYLNLSLADEHVDDI